MSDDTLTFTENPLDPSLFGDEDDVSNGADMHLHQNPIYRKSSRIHERDAAPGPRRTPLVIPADPKKVNGKQLVRATLKRDRDMLNTH
jgi:hypothetical protein